MPNTIKRLNERMISRPGVLPGFRVFSTICILGLAALCVYTLVEGLDPASIQFRRVAGFTPSSDPTWVRAATLEHCASARCS